MVSPISPHSEDSLSLGFKIALPTLKAELQKAARAWGVRYKKQHAIVTYFETDGSRATKDAQLLTATFEDVF